MLEELKAKAAMKQKSLNSLNEIIPGFWISGVTGASDREKLKSANISHVLTMGSNMPPPFPKHFQYLCCDILDEERVDLRPFVRDCMRYITDGRETGTGVLIHCEGGISRSGSIAVAFAMSELSLDRTGALKIVQRARSFVRPNSAFWEQLRLLEDEQSLQGIKASGEIEKTLP